MNNTPYPGSNLPSVTPNLPVGEASSDLDVVLGYITNTLLGIGILVLLILGVYLATYLIFRHRRQKNFANLVTFEVRLSEKNESKIEAADQMFNALHSLKKSFPENITQGEVTLAWEIVGTKDGIKFFVSCPSELEILIEKTIYGYYQDADVSKSKPIRLTLNKGDKLKMGFLIQKEAAFRPIKTYKELAVDSLSNITSVMSNLAEGELVALQVLTQAAGENWKKEARKFVAETQKKENDPEKKVLVKTNPQILSKIEEMANQFAFKTVIRYAVISFDSSRANRHSQNVVTSFAQFSNEVNSFKNYKPTFLGSLKKNFEMRSFPFGWFKQKYSILSTEELATVFHFPSKDVTTPLINWLKSKTAPVDPLVPSSGGTIIGMAYHRGNRRPVAITEKDRMRHMYVIGKTGTGKSEFLIEMIKQDIRAGHGVCVIDPHGELCEDVLHFVPPERAEDVIYFDPSDTERPIGFNILECESDKEKFQITEGVINMMRKMYDPNNQGFVGPIFEHSIRNAMLSVMYEPGAGFIEVVRCVTDDNYVKTLLPKIKDPIVKRYWTDEMAQTTQQTKSDSLGYIVSKFGKFITNRLMRNIIGQAKSGFNMREAMDTQKIVLINLSKGKLGEEGSAFLGLLFVPKILGAAMSRVDVAQEQRKPFFFYVDEFQNFATPDFATILSEARKYKLALTVANQFIGQMEDSVRKAVFGNVGTMVVLRTGVEDAKYLKEEMQGVFDENDIINQEKYHAYVKTIVNNEPVPPFSLDTTKDYAKHLEEKAKGAELAKKIIEMSRLKYGRDVRFVEAEIQLRAKL